MSDGGEERAQRGEKRVGEGRLDCSCVGRGDNAIDDDISVGGLRVEEALGCRCRHGSHGRAGARSESE